MNNVFVFKITINNLFFIILAKKAIVQGIRKSNKLNI